MTFKVYRLGGGVLYQCTNHHDAFDFINRNEYEVYTIYCGGVDIVVIEVIKK